MLLLTLICPLMKSLKYSLPALALLLGLSSCGLYKKYERPQDIQTEVFRPEQIATVGTDTTSLAQLPWQELFTDVQLQALIRQALKQNVDLLTASLSVKQAEAQLRSARLSFFPSLTISPSMTTTRFCAVIVTSRAPAETLTT